ncbi:hypothetical protein RND81_13G057300 [Saponaria officinalis]|uniref:Uncharacterized protein n=1 Tax=Saponaria officinalis TaxID=3572 RepID=A0AAW1GWG0_SAPOF
MEVDSCLVKLCIEAATASTAAVDRWRLQRRTLQRLPSPLAYALLHRLLHRRLLSPSLLEMFKFSVEEVDLRGENSVDAEWIAYIGAYRYLCSLNVAGCNRINNSAIWPLAGMSSLRELDLSGCAKITNAGMKHIVSISNLEKLFISRTGVTSDGIVLLSKLRNLLTLDLGGLPVSDAALHSLQVLCNLEHLDLWGSNITNNGAATLRNFLKLRVLILDWTKVSVLPNLNSLDFLNMSNCSIDSVMGDKSDQVTLIKLVMHGSTFLYGGKSFSSIETSCLTFLNLSNTSFDDFIFLRQMHALEHLDLSFSSMQDDAVEAISCVGANLRHLNLNNTNISSTGVEILAGHVPKLEVLSLSHTSIDDRALLYFSTMPSLKVLDLSNTFIKGDTQDEFLSLAALEDLEHLERLDLGGTLVTDTALHVLINFKKLTHLSLNSTHLADNCLDFLSSVKKLVNLDMQGTLVTNGALDSFHPPVTLEMLDLRGCWLLTLDALTSFCRKHPGVFVRHDYLNIPGVDANCSTHLASSQKGSKDLKQKQKNRMSSPASPFQFKKDVIDQRIKYGREELLAFQHLSPPLTLPDNDDTNAILFINLNA